MSPEIVKRDDDSVTICVTLPLNGPMLEAEEAIQAALNEVGVIAEKENLARFDTDGSPIQVGPVRFTSKGRSPSIGHHHGGLRDRCTIPVITNEGSLRRNIII